MAQSRCSNQSCSEQTISYSFVSQVRLQCAHFIPPSFEAYLLANSVRNHSYGSYSPPCCKISACATSSANNLSVPWRGPWLAPAPRRRCARRLHLPCATQSAHMSPDTNSMSQSMHAKFHPWSLQNAGDASRCWHSTCGHVSNLASLVLQSLPEKLPKHCCLHLWQAGHRPAPLLSNSLTSKGQADPPPKQHLPRKALNLAHYRLAFAKTLRPLSSPNAWYP